MHSIITSFLALFLGFSALAMEDQLGLHEEASPDFELKHDFLRAGNIQYFSSRFDSEDLKHFPPQLLALDIHGHLTRKHIQLLFYKMAYTLPFKADAVFEQHLYGNNDFMQAQNSKLTNIKFLNPQNTLEQEHTFPSVKGFPGSTIYVVEHFEASTKGANNARSCFDSIAPLYEDKLLEPRTMVTRTTSSNQKELLSGMTYASYYPYGNQTLVVSYKFAILEPGLKLKIAFSTGIAQHFLKNESDSLLESVKRTRHYIEGTMAN